MTLLERMRALRQRSVWKARAALVVVLPFATVAAFAAIAMKRIGRAGSGLYRWLGMHQV